MPSLSSGIIGALPATGSTARHAAFPRPITFLCSAKTASSSGVAVPARPIRFSLNASARATIHPKTGLPEALARIRYLDQTSQLIELALRDLAARECLDRHRHEPGMDPHLAVESTGSGRPRNPLRALASPALSCAARDERSSSVTKSSPFKPVEHGGATDSEMVGHPGPHRAVRCSVYRRASCLQRALLPPHRRCPPWSDSPVPWTGR